MKVSWSSTRFQRYVPRPSHRLLAPKVISSPATVMGPVPTFVPCSNRTPCAVNVSVMWPCSGPEGMSVSHAPRSCAGAAPLGVGRAVGAAEGLAGADDTSGGAADLVAAAGLPAVQAISESPTAHAAVSRRRRPRATGTVCARRTTRQVIVASSPSPTDGGTHRLRCDSLYGATSPWKSL